jgi:cobalamin biosynthesis protein CobT
MAQEYSPTEIFKRATAATLRAIAERDDVTVGFGPEAAGVSGARVRLPNPPRDLPAEEAAQLRGAADSVALRLRYHDDAVHSKRAPGSPLARAVFEAVEQARVEALGARRMAGVATNLEAMLEEQYRRQGFERITERADSTMAEAVRLLTREALTKERPPPAARRGRPAGCCRISTSTSAMSPTRPRARSRKAARRPKARTRARARVPPRARRTRPAVRRWTARPRTRRTPPKPGTAK